MKTKEHMVNRVRVCRPGDNLAEVVATMWENACGALPVVDAEGQVTSIITDRDIAIALGTRNLRASDVQVQDVASPRIFICLEDDDISVALRTMVSQNVRRLPVVDNEGKLAGLISTDDFLLDAGVLSLRALETMVDNHGVEATQALAASA